MTPPDAARLMVEAEGIHKYFADHHVLRGIDLNVRKGEVVVIVGPSGGGKSTFLRSLNHLDAPDQGWVRIDGELLGYRSSNGGMVAVSDAILSQQRRQIGMVFQQFNLFSHMTALENIMSGPLRVLRSDRATAADEARRQLALVGLEDKAASYPEQLSGGQQQRVAIARALINNPTILLADEPTGNLDTRTGDDILTLIRDLHSRLGSTIVIVTHDMNVARSCQRTITLRDGRIVEDTSLESRC
jgi:polar amino acid transport system ATP-binding protein